MNRLPVNRMLRPPLLVPIFLSALGLLAACAGRVENVWTDPSVEGRSLGFHKVATIALFKEGGMRRVAEDDLARAIKGGEKDATGVDAVPSYTLLESDELKDPSRARAKLEAAGFDGAVVISIVGSEQRVTATPSTYSHWGGPGWGVMYDTGTVRTDTIVHVQTNIYAVDGAKLLWSGTSRSLNPRDVSRVVSDVVRDVGHALRKQGLVP